MNKVIIYCSQLLPLSQTFVLAQLRTLKQWRPILIGRKRVPGSLSLNGIEMEILATGRKRWQKWAESMRYWMNRPDPEAVRVFQRHNAHLVHVHFGTDAVEIWPSVKAAGIPMLVTLHGYDINIYRDWWEKGHGGLRKRVYPRRLLSMAQSANVGFVAVSEAVRQRAIEYGISGHKVAVAYIGVDTQRFQPSGLPLAQRRKRVLFVGRMVEKKAPLLMVRVFAQVREQVPDAELVMAGDGPLRGDAERLASELNIPVTFTGALSSEQVLAQVHEARVFCLPSVTAANGDAEGFGLVLLEAQACGVPVVSSAKGGAQEGIIEGRTGYQVAERDTTGLVERLRRVLEDREPDIKSKEAVLFVKTHFDLRACATYLESCYDSYATSVVSTNRELSAKRDSWAP